MSKPLACLRGRLIARERTVGCSLGHYRLPAIDLKVSISYKRSILAGLSNFTSATWFSTPPALSPQSAGHAGDTHYG